MQVGDYIYFFFIILIMFISFLFVAGKKKKKRTKEKKNTLGIASSMHLWFWLRILFCHRERSVTIQQVVVIFTLWILTSSLRSSSEWQNIFTPWILTSLTLLRMTVLLCYAHDDEIVIMSKPSKIVIMSPKGVIIQRVNMLCHFEDERSEDVKIQGVNIITTCWIVTLRSRWQNSHFEDERSEDVKIQLIVLMFIFWILTSLTLLRMTRK